MPSSDPLKASIRSHLEKVGPELIDVARKIHGRPELCFQEVYASGLLCEVLQRNALAAQRPAYGLETAFVAEFGQPSGPCVGIISEYDALPNVGHACGHNIIAAAGLGAALALASLGDRLPGRVRYLGTPAEEGGGGKELMARQGAFKDVDCAMMVHPSSEDLRAYPLLARARVKVAYRGQPAHAASAPEEGRNALDGLVLAYQSIGALRQHLPPAHRVHGIIVNGGSAVNVIPDYAEGLFAIRAPDMVKLNALRVRLDACFEAGALASGTAVDIQWEDVVYADMRHNWPLADAYQRNAEALGRVFERFEDVPLSHAASTDMGNISYALPSIHPMIGIAPKSVVHHQRAFTDWSASDQGMQAVIDGAAALAMTAIDFMTDAELRANVRQTFETSQRASTATMRLFSNNIPPALKTEAP